MVGQCRVGHASHAGSALWPTVVGRTHARRRLKLKNSFLFFIRFQTEFKLQKFASKYPELQKL
jgi:hypothetical protein